MAEAQWQKLSRALAQWLEAEGVLNWESGPGGNTFTERLLPSTPDDAVGIRLSGGFESSYKHPEDLPTVQVLTRSKSPQSALEQAWKVYNRLHGAKYVTLPEDIFLLYAIAQQSAPAFVEQDSGGRYVYSTNYRLETEAVTAQRGG